MVPTEVLYIQLKDGQPVKNPVLLSNIISAFPELDPDNLPEEQFARFVRVAPPKLGPYEMYVGASYQWVDGVVKDVHEVRSMTDEEKAAKQQKAKDEWAARPQVENWAAWSFNEETCRYEPPIPRPDIDNDKFARGIRTVWSGADNNWKDTPPIPGSPAVYKFDFIAWEWVAR